MTDTGKDSTLATLIDANEIADQLAEKSQTKPVEIDQAIGIRELVTEYRQLSCDWLMNTTDKARVNQWT